MAWEGWLIAVGMLLVAIYATSHHVARLPVSPAIVYFTLGMALGPWGLDVLRPDPVRDATLLEHACEVAVLISLFATGSAVGTTLRVRHWRVPVRLATTAMLVTIALLALFAHGVLGLSIGAAIVLAAALAPTDPVLAGDVQVADAADRDRLRFGLTGEAGLNDGAAFPFVLLGLVLMGGEALGADGWLRWTATALWSVAGALALGALLGLAAGKWVLRRTRAGIAAESSHAFLGLGLVAVAYGIAVALQTFGFLAVFAAAVALQWAVAGEGGPKPAAAAAAIAPAQRFNADLESLSEFAVVIVLGALFTTTHVPGESVWVALLLFLTVRPIAVLVALRDVRMGREQRALASWFGIRGVGSLYYVFYATTHGAQGAEAERVLGLVLGVVAMSILVHGISVTPLMGAYGRHVGEWRKRRKRMPAKRA